jgi:hypothetical protein
LLNQSDRGSRTLFGADGSYLQMDSADPREGYSWDEIDLLIQNYIVPSNDRYGQLFLVLHEQLEIFRNECRKRGISYVATCVDVRDLQTALIEYKRGDARFDRIEVSNIVDGGYVGVEGTLAAVGPFLREDNAYAAVVSLFMNAVHIVQRAYRTQVLPELIATVMPYLPQPGQLNNILDPRVSQYITAAEYCSPWADWFAEYFESFDLKEEARRHGLKARERHTIVPKLPWRFKGDRNNIEGSRARLLRLLESNLCGGERYVEWVRE